MKQLGNVLLGRLRNAIHSQGLHSCVLSSVESDTRLQVYFTAPAGGITGFCFGTVTTQLFAIREIRERKGVVIRPVFAKN